MHCAHVALIACRVGATRRNASQSDVLPIPASPVTKTTWRCEAAASSKAANSRFISGCRPTNIGTDELAAGSAGASTTGAMKIAPLDEAPDEAWANRVVAEVRRISPMSTLTLSGWT